MTSSDWSEFHGCCFEYTCRESVPTCRAACRAVPAFPAIRVRRVLNVGSGSGARWAGRYTMGTLKTASGSVTTLPSAGILLSEVAEN